MRIAAEPVSDASPLERLRWKKFSVYDVDLEAFASARECVPLPEYTQSLEAAVMDVS